MPPRPTRSAGRADRILDAAGDLLLRLGYRKVTIEDIARQAGIGKGTIYLHWRTKEQLFEALLLRESADLVEEILTRLREDPAEIIPHRFARASFLAALSRPLVVALAAGDTDLLGTLRDSAVRAQDLLATERFFAVMTRHRLLRDDVANLAYAMRAASAGFYLIDTLEPETAGADLDPEAKADALAHTIRHAFEPAGGPDPAALSAAAVELAAVLDDLIATYRKWIYSRDPAQEPG